MIRTMCCTVLGVIQWTPQLAVRNQGKWGDLCVRFYTDQLRSSTVDVYACHYLLKRHYLLSKLHFHIKLTTFCNLIFKFNEMLKL